MALGSTQKDNANTPAGSVYTPNTANSDLTPMEGGPISTDANGQKSAPAGVTILVRAALTPYVSNPTQTAASGADTLYKLGAAGTAVFAHVSGQNNTPANVYLAFDQSTTGAGNQVYVIASGQAYAFDRAGAVLHFSSPAQQPFGGQAGITVEAFA